MRLIATAILLAAIGARAQTSDEILATSFEYRCDGNGCSYCSPAAPDPVCGVSSHCLPDTHAVSTCAYPAGAGMQGATCSTDATCSDAFTCVNTGPDSVCAHWCQVGAGGCPGGLTCYSLGTQVFTGTTEWGVCF